MKEIGREQEAPDVAIDMSPQSLVLALLANIAYEVEIALTMISGAPGSYLRLRLREHAPLTFLCHPFI